MLDRRDISKLSKPLIVAMGCKTAFFLALIVFLIASNLTGLAHQNAPISHCDNYLNAKFSSFQTQILLSQFFMALLGLSASSFSLILFALLIIQLKKQHKQKQRQKKRLSENGVKAHIILAFIESTSAVNIFARAIQKVREQTNCNMENRTNFTVILCLSLLIIAMLLVAFFVFARFLALVHEKQKALEEYSFYSDQITLQENLLFNKTGYIKELLKMEDCTSRSSNMKDDLLKNFPSGYKANADLSPKRQIVYRLRGGHTETLSPAMSSLPVPKIPEQENQGETSNNNELSKSRWQNGSQHGKPLQLNLTAINNDKTLDETPNDEPYQYVGLTNNIIDLSVDKGLVEDLNESSEYESSQQENQNPDFQQKLSMRKAGPITPKKQKDIALEMKLEEELRQKFNLTSNLDSRRRYAHRRNEQNIDDHGNYLFVDVDKIKKRSKLLNFEKMNEEASSVDPNLLYSKGELPPRQKRLPKKHEKYVADYLKKLNKLKKEEVLFEQEESLTSEEDFDEDEESDSSSESEESSEDPVPVTVVDPVTGQAMTVMPEKKKNRKNQGPELYLYIQKRKLTGKEHKLKLYEDEEGFYDSEEQKQNEQGQNQGANRPEKGLSDANNSVEKVPMMGALITGGSKEHQLQKSKHEERMVLTNKRLETDEARMLRFIRRKYISKEPEHMMPEMGHVFPPNMSGYEGYDPNMHAGHSMMPGLGQMNPGMNQGHYPGQSQYHNQQGQLNQYHQQYPNAQFEGNIFSPPPESSSMTPVKQHTGMNHHQMSPNSPNFSPPFNMHTPVPSSQSASNGSANPPMQFSNHQIQPPQNSQTMQPLQNSQMVPPPQNSQTIPPQYNQMQTQNSQMMPPQYNQIQPPLHSQAMPSQNNQMQIQNSQIAPQYNQYQSPQKNQMMPVQYNQSQTQNNQMDSSQYNRMAPQNNQTPPQNNYMQAKTVK